MRFPVLVISLLLLTACSTQIPQPSTTYASPTTVLICHRPFRDVIDWKGMMWPPTETESMTITKLEGIISTITPQAIRAGEVFLNNCVDPAYPLLKQINLLDDMSELATMIYPPYLLPPDWKEKGYYVAQVQPVNLDNDNSSELILTAQVINPWGFFHAIYDLEESTGTWHGTLVWPSHDGEHLLFSGYKDKPLILPLSIAAAKGQTFVLIEGNFLGADHSAKHVWIWEWQDNHLEVVLHFRLSNWCGQEWHNWEVIEEGILVNATISTERCQAREAILYYWENGEFTSRTP